MVVYVIFNNEGEMIEICRDMRSALDWLWTECDGEFTIKHNENKNGESIIESWTGEEYRLVKWYTYS